MLALPRTSRRNDPAEAVPPPAHAALAPLAFLFTDLQDSTGLYERVGDHDAYEIVHRHFCFVQRIVLASRGSVVKTTGDGVMAAFDRPVDAVKAALAIQGLIGHFNRSHAPADDRRHVAIKLGVNWGGSLRVDAERGLDYFGSAVNLAARLRGHSRGGEVMLSEVVANDPGVRLLLGPLETCEENLPFKGFEGPVRVVRVMPRAGRGADAGGTEPAPAGVWSSIGAMRALWVLGGPRLS